MKFFVLKNNKSVIYRGSISKVQNESGAREYDHKIVSYFKRNSSGVWEEHQNTDSHIDLLLTKSFARGLVSEFPSLVIAENFCK